MNTLLTTLLQIPTLEVSGIDIFLASIPVILLIILLGFLKLSGDKSAVITLIATVLIAILAFKLPAGDTGLAFLYGVVKAIFPILIIIIMAIFSYNVLVHTKKIEVIKNQFSAISTDKSIQVLLLTWGFGGLLEGMAGFGTAVAIPAAILISLGFKPMFAAVSSLIANSVATGFGAVGTPVKVLATEAGVESIQQLSANVVLQLSPLMFIIPFILVFMTNPSLKALPKNIILSVLVGGVSLATQYFVAINMGAETPAIIGSVAAIIVIIAFGKITESKKDKDAATHKKYSMNEIMSAWSVYAFILFFIIITSPLFPSLRAALQSVAVTRFSFDIAGMEKIHTITWLTDAGLLLFLGSMIGGLIQRAKIAALFKLLAKTIWQQRKTVITVSCLVGLSTVMDIAGMIAVIGTALALATGSFYPFFAPTIGCLGTFLTGSDTSSNILFGKLQSTVAGQIGADPTWLAAANTAGATGGKIISPQSIAVATSAIGEQGKEGEIMKKAIPFALGYIVVAGIMVYFFA